MRSGGDRPEGWRPVDTWTSSKYLIRSGIRGRGSFQCSVRVGLAGRGAGSGSGPVGRSADRASRHSNR
eukprot:6922339-Prymnesium_polylepis.1